MEIQQNYPLSELTTFALGGPARFFGVAESREEILEALEFAKRKELEILVLGKGSNVVVSDEGFDGLVIQNQIKGLEISDSGLVTVGAGENWDDVVKSCVEKNLAGIECLSGVPGSGGGSVVQNIGAYGQTLGDRVINVTALETATGQERQFSAAECEFVYRNSFFKRNLNKYILISFQMQLEPHGVPTLSYAPVVQHFENKPAPTLAQVRELVLSIRASKGYLIMPGVESYQTAGSFFKNPVVTRQQFERLKPVLGQAGLNRYWETGSGVKLAAAFLLQESGFGKGYRDGNVGISPKHSLSLVNFGSGKALEIKALADRIKSTVLEKFNIELEEEVLYIGKF